MSFLHSWSVPLVSLRDPLPFPSNNSSCQRPLPHAVHVDAGARLNFVDLEELDTQCSGGEMLLDGFDANYPLVRDALAEAIEEASDRNPNFVLRPD